MPSEGQARVVVPTGHGEGSRLSLSTREGRRFNVRVPRGVRAGGSFLVNIHPETREEARKREAEAARRRAAEASQRQEEAVAALRAHPRFDEFCRVYLSSTKYSSMRSKRIGLRAALEWLDETDPELVQRLGGVDEDVDADFPASSELACFEMLDDELAARQAEEEKREAAARDQQRREEVAAAAARAQEARERARARDDWWRERQREAAAARAGEEEARARQEEQQAARARAGDVRIINGDGATALLRARFGCGTLVKAVQRSASAPAGQGGGAGLFGRIRRGFLLNSGAGSAEQSTLVSGCISAIEAHVFEGEAGFGLAAWLDTTGATPPGQLQRTLGPFRLVGARTNGSEPGSFDPDVDVAAEAARCDLRLVSDPRRWGTEKVASLSDWLDLLVRPIVEELQELSVGPGTFVGFEAAGVEYSDARMTAANDCDGGLLETLVRRGDQGLVAKCELVQDFLPDATVRALRLRVAAPATLRQLERGFGWAASEAQPGSTRRLLLEWSSADDAELRLANDLWNFSNWNEAFLNGRYGFSELPAVLQECRLPPALLERMIADPACACDELVTACLAKLADDVVGSRSAPSDLRALLTALRKSGRRLPLPGGLLASYAAKAQDAAYLAFALGQCVPSAEDLWAISCSCSGQFLFAEGLFVLLQKYPASKVVAADALEWLDQRGTRRREGRCVQCGGKGHVAQACPFGVPALNADVLFRDAEVAKRTLAVLGARGDALDNNVLSSFVRNGLWDLFRDVVAAGQAPPAVPLCAVVGALPDAAPGPELACAFAKAAGPDPTAYESEDLARAFVKLLRKKDPKASFKKVAGGAVVSESTEAPAVVAIRLGKYRMLKALLAAGAVDVNAPGQNGDRPIHAALDPSRPTADIKRAVEILLGAGTPLNCSVQGKAGRSALDWLSRCPARELRERLRNSGNAFKQTEKAEKRRREKERKRERQAAAEAAEGTAARRGAAKSEAAAPAPASRGPAPVAAAPAPREVLLALVASAIQDLAENGELPDDELEAARAGFEEEEDDDDDARPDAALDEDDSDASDAEGAGAVEAKEPEAPEDGAFDFEGSLWDVEIAEPCLKWVKKNRTRRPKLIAAAVRRLEQLADGEWNARNRKKLEGVSGDLLLFEAKLSKGARLLWELAIAFSERRSREAAIYAEAITVWSIVPDHDNVGREMAKICEARRRGRGFRLRQALRGYQAGADDPARRGGPVATRQEPRLFQPTDVEEKSVHFDPPANPAANTYTLLKFYAMTKSMAGALTTASAVDVPFKVTDQEHRIITSSAESSTLLIGRSGTGKTTCLVFKMFRDYSAYWERAVTAGPWIPVQSAGGKVEGLRHLRQVFVTMNPVLRTEVEKVFKTIATHQAKALGVAPPSGLKGSAGLSRLDRVDDARHPLFLTEPDLLRLLDRTIGGDRFLDGRSVSTGAYNCSLRTLAGYYNDNDDDDDDDGGAPDSAAVLEDGDVTGARRTGEEVTYVEFLRTLWPNMQDGGRRSALHPALVWTEIKSYIKGSLEACMAGGALCLDAYLELGRKRSSMTESQRREVSPSAKINFTVHPI